MSITLAQQIKRAERHTAHPANFELLEAVSDELQLELRKLGCFPKITGGSTGPMVRFHTHQTPAGYMRIRENLKVLAKAINVDELRAGFKGNGWMILEYDNPAPRDYPLAECWDLLDGHKLYQAIVGITDSFRILKL